MTDQSNTTIPTGDRNTPRDIVFDMDDNFTRLQANLDVLDELTKDYGLKGTTDNQSNVVWMLHRVIGDINELRERYDQLFEVVVCQEGAPPAT